MGSGMNYEHKATPLQAWRDALAFVEHTAKIIGNPKHFNPKNDFENQTLCQIMNLAHDAFQKIIVANSIDARKEPDKANERLALQEFAIADVELLKSYLALAHRQYHVNAGKFWHWAGVKLGDLDRNLAAWHRSDLKRGKYREGLTHIVNITFPRARTALAISFRDPAKIKGNYRKLRRLARLVRRGKKSEQRFDASYQAIRSCVALGDSKRLLRKMDSIYNNLKMEIAA